MPNTRFDEKRSAKVRPAHASVPSLLAQRTRRRAMRCSTACDRLRSDDHIPDSCHAARERRKSPFARAACGSTSARSRRRSTIATAST